MKIHTSLELVRYIRHHIAGSEFQDVKAVEEFVDSQEIWIASYNDCILGGSRDKKRLEAHVKTLGYDADYFSLRLL